MSTFIGRWSNEQVEQAGALWREGVPFSKIAAAIGKSRSALAGIANRHRDLFPKRNEHLHRVLTEKKPEPKRKRARKQKPAAPAAPVAKGIVTSVSRPTVFRAVTRSEPTKDALRAMLHAAVLNTR